MVADKERDDRVAHWDNVYETKAATEVSWFEPEPTNSLKLIKQTFPQGGPIIDVGGGASYLVDRPIAEGIWDVTVLDISSKALGHAMRRLGQASSGVHWLHADIVLATELGRFRVWHDRAVFHFLTNSDDRKAYLQRLNASLIEGGYFIVSTFAPDGPEKCSGLSVCRYDVNDLASVLGGGFSRVSDEQVYHVTPAGKTQLFTLAVFRKNMSK